MEDYVKSFYTILAMRINQSQFANQSQLALYRQNKLKEETVDPRFDVKNASFDVEGCCVSIP